MKGSIDDEQYKDGIEVYFLYGLDDKAALSCKQELKEKIPGITYYCYPLCAAIGLHTWIAYW